MRRELEPLLAAVRTNCHISDARHARELTLCTYLLEMRELFRWERGIALGAPVPQPEVRAWMAEREALWSSLEDAALVRLPIGAAAFDPFDADGANRALAGRGLVYGAGVGRFGKPQFFLGELLREEPRGGARVLVAGREYARDLTAAPAASRDGTIYVREDALRRWLWERAEAWAGKQADGALKAALDAWGYAAAPGDALARMADAEVETLILHELGERAAGERLGPAWERLLGGLAQRRAELFVRAVRDHLADCLVTLPALVARGASASLHFWFANLQGLRRELFPRIAAAYGPWRDAGDAAALRDAIAAGAAHWERVAGATLALGSADAIEALALARTTAL